jgi:hypothetical protein
MLGEELIDLVEQATRWRQLSMQVRDKRALDALVDALADIERKIACLETEIFQAAC